MPFLKFDSTHLADLILEKLSAKNEKLAEYSWVVYAQHYLLSLGHIFEQSF